MQDNISIQDLQAYKYMSKEIEALQLELKQLYQPIKSPKLESIGARGNEVSNPTEQALHKVLNLEYKINVKINALAEELERIQEWLDTVDDIKVRTCIQWHYLVGLTWKETTRKVLGDYCSGDNARKIVYRYFEYKNKQD